MSGLGSDSWVGVNENHGSELSDRANDFVATIKWDSLVKLASQMRGTGCTLSEKFSIGHFNLVKRVIFKDGVSWVVRLRLPELPSIFGTYEGLSTEGSMSIEVATMKYIRSKTNIPIPQVFGYSVDADNEIGAPYIFMEYLHGNVALELQAQRGCEPHVFGTAEEDVRFWRQMASIHVQLANLTSSQIGSLHEDQGNFILGPELVTGKGPWETSSQFYATLAHRQLQAAEQDAEADVRNKDSFKLPFKFTSLIEDMLKRGKAQSKGAYAMANRDLGAHNVLVDDNFNIIGLIDFDGCMFAPIEVAAQFPLFMGLERAVPGYVETRDLALKRIETQRHLIPRYIDLVRTAAAEQEQTTGAKNSNTLADALMSDAAAAVQGISEYGQLQDFVNDSWMVGYGVLAQKTGSVHES